jgi:ABC-2 type transport system permease protein
MSGVLALLRKELLGYFRSPIAYFVLAVYFVGTGYFFTYNVFLTGDATMNETLVNMGILLIVILPMVSMRLFAAEYSSGTMELLAALPLRAWQIVLGKFLGAVVILLLLTAGTAINLVPLHLYGNPETATIVSGYLGFMLLGMASLAIGQLFSGLTENQIVAALLTVCVLLGFWFVGYLQSFQQSYELRGLVRHLSFSLHYANFVQGLLRTESVAFFLSVCAIALALNASWLELRR